VVLVRQMRVLLVETGLLAQVVLVVAVVVLVQ
jgi:hypothetical protein